MDILTFIPKGEKNAVSRNHLRTVTNLSDREVRRAIAEKRKSGVPILASKHGGYFIAENIEQIEEYLKWIDSYNTSYYFDFLPLRKMVVESKGQKLVKVRQHFRKLGMTIPENQLSMNEIYKEVL